jgi:beta-galactosidase
MCLNDQWRFMPAAGAAAEHPTGAWGVLRVPGSWSRCGSLPGVEERPEGAPWTDVDLEQLGRGWYEYDVAIPAEWEGRAILLELTRVSTDAVIYANGIECGEIHWPRGEVDITDAVTPGEVATLRILVLSVHDQEEVVVYMGVGEGMQWTEPASLASRGIIGEAFLRSQPAGAHVGGVFVQPSVRDESITLDVHLADVTQAGDVAFTARMLDESGAVERVFEATRAVDAANSQTVSLTWDWPDPRLWDLWQPELYTLILEAEGAGIADAYSQEFGFREFWIDGLSFYLNGTEIRLRPINVSDNYNSAAWVVEAIEYTLGQYREMGFNIGEHWPNDESERGSVFLRDL